MATVKSRDLGIRIGANQEIIQAICCVSAPAVDFLLLSVPQKCRLIALEASWAVAAGAGVTGMPKKVPSGGATIAAGTSLLQAAIALDGSALRTNTTRVIPAGITATQLALVTADASLEFNEFDNIGMDISASAAAMTGAVFAFYFLPLPAKKFWKSF